MTDILELLKWAGYLLMGIAVGTLSYTYSKKLIDWMRFQSIGTRDYIVERLKMMFIEQDPYHVLLAQFALSFGLGIVMFMICIPNWGLGLFLGSVITAIGWKAPKPIIDYLYEQRVKKFVLQMVDALSLMANGMRSGLSIVQAVAMAAEEMPDPIRQELNLVLNENKVGVPLEESFTNLSKRIVSDDVEMFVTSINILKETGGNLAETFDTIVQTIRDRIKVENKISAMTAQGKIQGYVLMGVPPGLGAMFYFQDPEFMGPLFTTVYGWIALGVVLALEIIGFFVIMKIVKIEV